MNTQDIKLFRNTLRKLEREMGWQLKSETECCGVTLSQCHIIAEVGSKGEASIVDLSSIMGLDTSTLSRNINGMVNLGLLNRITNPDNRRYVTISLTKQGKKIYDSIEDTCNLFYFNVFNYIPKEKHPQVLESFELFINSLLKAREERPFSCCSNGGENFGE
jgi:DNA-binding MarR family transcriptional regulator